MTPTKPSPLDQQEISMAMRFGVAYLLLVTAWLILCAAITRASDSEEAVTSELKSEPIPAGIRIGRLADHFPICSQESTVLNPFFATASATADALSR